MSVFRGRMCTQARISSLRQGGRSFKAFCINEWHNSGT